MPHGELKPEARSNGEGPMALVRELQDVTIPGLKAALAAEHAAREQAEARVRVRHEAIAAEQAAHAETRSELDGARSSLGGVIQHQRETNKAQAESLSAQAETIVRLADVLTELARTSNVMWEIWAREPITVADEKQKGSDETDAWGPFITAIEAADAVLAIQPAEPASEPAPMPPLCACSHIWSAHGTVGGNCAECICDHYEAPDPSAATRDAERRS